MATPMMSSDEGEIIEATPLPRSDKNGHVDPTGRTRPRLSHTPDLDDSSRNPANAPFRRSRSPRGFKRSHDEPEYQSSSRGRDPRRFRVRYEADPRDGHRRGRHPYEDPDRPQSRGSAHDEERDRNRDNTASRPFGQRRDDRNFDRGYDGYPDKRPRNRSRSPRGGRRDRGRRDRGRFGRDPTIDHAESIKYSAHNERYSQGNSVSKRATLAEASDTSRRDTKSYQGVTGDRIADKATSAPTHDTQKRPEKEPEPEPDWDGTAAVDEEAAVEAEIQRRRLAREAAYKRAVGAATPNVQGLQVSDKPAVSTPASTQRSTPHITEANTPRSDWNSPAVSASGGQEAMSPASLDIANDQELINIHGKAKVDDEDGPSAADYDPTVDMKEDELRDELRYGNVGLHGKDRHPSQAEIVAPKNEEPETKGAGDVDDGDDDDFDMFADDFDDNKFAATKPATKATPAQDNQDPSQLGQANGGGILEGDDKDGYYKIRPGEVLGGRYQVQSTLGRGMFSGVARAMDITTKKLVAIKIMRNNDALRKGGFTEIAILQKLNAADPENKKHLVKFERSFEYNGHLCMAFENLSLNLREVLKKFGNNIGINLNATRAYAYQIFLALGHMRKCSIIHADLKPDNILVNESRNVLKICDLGTAIDRSDAATAHNEITPYLVSRFYRAPEIMLGMPYDYAVDMWSIGCTLYELYTGKILFTGDSNNQMLKNIMEIRGKLSGKLYRRGQLSHMHFDDLGNFISVERDKVLGKTTVRTLSMIKPTRDLRTRLLAASSGMNDTETREFNQFIDLLERCLTLNPDKRITPSEALKHPFFTQRMHSSKR
ncbi:kinase-like protein [Phialemonium atrogriseum]|uniref:non-specific serine/threonine protein kinase n=1 Tax=Phialemonium atrogriseum TaxID=1093897 RepID=A0AAJ0FKU1_9PEZI|nr:kinase-like protein [Phialemonium atrogriseum]KAK1771432.1 kinase-like protein [Phialemonium atrogriseum]